MAVVSTEPVLRVQDVHLSFAGVKAIGGVTFDVGPAELLAIIGPNGAGKTSVFNVLSGVYRPQRGRVTFLGEDLLARRPPEIAAMGLARTFQNVELFHNLTVLDNLMLGRHHHFRYGALAAVLWYGRARRPSWPPAPGSRRSSTSWSWNPGGATPCGCCRTGSRSASSWAGRWRWSPACSCWTSRWPG